MKPIPFKKPIAFKEKTSADAFVYAGAPLKEVTCHRHRLTRTSRHVLSYKELIELVPDMSPTVCTIRQQSLMRQISLHGDFSNKVTDRRL